MELLKKNYQLIPLIFLLIGLLIQNYIGNNNITIIKSLVFLNIIILIFFKKIKNEYLFFSFFLFQYLIFLTLYNNIPIIPAIRDGLRYFFPFVAMLYGIILKNQYKKVILILLIFILLNDFYQIFFYLFSPLFIKNANYSLHRVHGLVTFFDFFSFINLIGLLLVNEINIVSKKKNYLSLFFIIFVLWSFSYKNILILFLYLVFRNRKLIFYIIFIILPVFTFKYKEILSQISIRINRYIINNDSTRSESYSILFNNLKDFFIIGKGPGVFGGPASTRYKSLFYKDYNFNWHHVSKMATTDTYYPHLFVELGVLFSLVYLFFLFFLPLLNSKCKIQIFSIIIVISINSIFTFALNSIDYCFFSFLLIPIISENNLCEKLKTLL